MNLNSFFVGWTFDASYLQLKEWRSDAWTVSNFDFLGANDDSWFDFFSAPLSLQQSFTLILHSVFCVMNEIELLSWFHIDSCCRRSTIESLDMRDAFDYCWLRLALVMVLFEENSLLFRSLFECLMKMREVTMNFMFTNWKLNLKFIFYQPTTLTWILHVLIHLTIDFHRIFTRNYLNFHWIYDQIKWLSRNR